MVRGHVQHRADVAVAVAETGADDTAAGGLQHRHVHGRVAQHHRGRGRAGHVALHGDVAVHIDRVGRGLPDGEASHLEDMRQHPRRGGLAVGPGQRRDRDPAGRAFREQHVHDRAAHVAALAFGRRDVHPHAGAGVDLADRAAGLAEALGDVGGQEVDPADVETDGTDRPFGHQPVVGMDLVGHVDRGAAGGQVRGLAQEHDLARGRDGLVGISLLGQHPVGGLVQFQPGQHVLVALAAARVGVHDLDQFGNGAAAIADHMTGHPLGRGDQLAVDHQQPMVVAHDHAFHDHARAFLLGDQEGFLGLLVAHHVHNDAAAMVAVDRLDHHRIADHRGDLGAVLRVADVFLFRHRQAQILQQPGAEFLVGRDLDRDVRGLAGQRRLDPLLVLALADLDQAGIVQPDPGDVARFGGMDQRQRRRSQRPARGEIHEVVQHLFGLLGPGVLVRRDQVEDQVAGHFAGLQADLLGFVADQHLDLVGVPGGARERDGPGRAGLILQGKRHMGHQLAQIAVRRGARAFDQVLAVLGDHLGQRRHIAEQRVDQDVGEVTHGHASAAMQIDTEPDQRLFRIDVRPDVNRSLDDLHAGPPRLASAMP